MTGEEAKELPTGVLKAWVRQRDRKVIVDGVVVIGFDASGNMLGVDPEGVESEPVARAPRVLPPVRKERFVYIVVLEITDPGERSVEAERDRLHDKLEKELNLRFGSVFKSVMVSS